MGEEVPPEVVASYKQEKATQELLAEDWSLIFGVLARLQQLAKQGPETQNTLRGLLCQYVKFARAIYQAQLQLGIVDINDLPRYQMMQPAPQPMMQPAPQPMMQPAPQPMMQPAPQPMMQPPPMMPVSPPMVPPQMMQQDLMQQELIHQIRNMTPQEFDALPPAEQADVMSVRRGLGLSARP